MTSRVRRQRQTALAITCVLCAGALLLLVHQKESALRGSLRETTTASSSSSAQSSTRRRPTGNNRVPAAATGMPIRLRIARLGIDAPILPVGLMPDGAMGIPKKSHEIGWFSLGTKPGSHGNSVMAGHLDAPGNVRGVFWNLHTLQPGDEIAVRNDKGETSRFRIRELRSYPEDQLPMEAIFGTADGAHLQLITCQGTWQKTKKSYDQRLVVYSDLIE